MNSIWNNNVALFKKRFPQLAFLFDTPLAPEEKPFTVTASKSEALTAFEGTLPLHSKYNPQKEAQQLISQFPKEKTAAAFYSFGLGYAPIQFALSYPTLPLIIIEPDVRYVSQSFETLDWTPVLSHSQVIFAIGASAQEAASLIERFGISNVQIYESANQIQHASAYYTELKQNLTRAKQKENINTNTLERFAKLWLRNSCKNLPQMALCDGVKKFMNTNTTLPFVILAAGPSLAAILPHLAELKKRSIIVCVDTSLHACLNAGVEPDFIVLVDPQEACARHLDFLRSPSSVLITESAVWPSVLRFECKETVMCSSLFPLGKYFESQLGEKGKLGAGGSVTTTAWDFAYSTGTKKIYLAGMDLGFPGKQTHIRGSQFEERAHRLSVKTSPAETDSIISLMSANPQFALDYDNNQLLTDERMSLFSWWFEENAKKAKQSGCTTFSLTSQSLAINGIQKADIQDILSLPEAQKERDAFFCTAQKNAAALNQEERMKQFEIAKQTFVTHLQSLLETARKGIHLCDSAIKDRSKAQDTFAKLDMLDKEILTSTAKDAASLVFPTQRQLQKKAGDIPQEPILHQLYYSKLIYTELSESIKSYLTYL